ncbi:hypothetical protein U9M48_005411 [Paspalum notatum var. saurae]|uniref:Uncharacterized protein n=1 Tax=Paspalum notatum var. saurae TaxID=547442 RepID=A0AAQ3SII2_PASNO
MARLRAWPEEAALNQKPLVVIPWSRGIQHVKHCRVIEQRLPETGFEERNADEHIRLHLSNVAEDDIPRAWAVYVSPLIHQISKLKDIVDNEYLIRVNVQVIHTNRLPTRRDDAVELEWHPKLARTIAEPAPCLLNPSSWAKARLGEVNAGDPHFRWPSLPSCQIA